MQKNTVSPPSLPSCRTPDVLPDSSNISFQNSPPQKGALAIRARLSSRAFIGVNCDLALRFYANLLALAPPSLANGGLELVCAS